MLRQGDIPPIVFGTPRKQVLELLGKPTSWVSRNDPLFATPRRDFHTSDSFSFGSITFSFDSRDQLDCISIYLGFEISYPQGFMFFPTYETRVAGVAEMMRSFDIPFDISDDGNCMRTDSGVEIVRGFREPDRHLDLVLGVLSYRDKRKISWI